MPRDSVLITDLRFLLVDQLFNPSTLRVPYAHQVPVFTLSELVYGIENRLSSGVVLEFRERLQMLQECLFASIALLTSFVSSLCQLPDDFRGSYMVDGTLNRFWGKEIRSMVNTGDDVIRSSAKQWFDSLNLP